ncbi:hypothetical protein [Bacillus cereus]|uniref:hypothetical protein n=1 Tax=Bacillus cereus TaxID=1396 RepID=UPI0020D272B2|nr:hypothetical protein [Bacillus cereus]
MTDKLNELFTLQSELDNRIISERNIEKALDEWFIGIMLSMGIRGRMRNQSIRKCYKAN